MTQSDEPKPYGMVVKLQLICCLQCIIKAIFIKGDITMSKILSKKTLMITIGAILVVAIAVITIVLIISSKDVYRIIKVFEVNGSASVVRTDVGELEAYNGMNLESGDKIIVTEDSTVRLVLDSDKYISVEPDSILSIEATGSAKSNKTKINLEQGSIINTITEPLNANSTYTVTTPKATMAVRGTVFRVSIEKAEDGTYTTSVETMEGKVLASLLDENDQATGESVLIEGGKKAIIKADPEKKESDIVSFFIETDADVNYEALPEFAIMEIISLYDETSCEKLEPIMLEISKIYDVKKISENEAQCQQDLRNGIGLPRLNNNETPEGDEQSQETAVPPDEPSEETTTEETEQSDPDNEETSEVTEEENDDSSPENGEEDTPPEDLEGDSDEDSIDGLDEDDIITDDDDFLGSLDDYDDGAENPDYDINPDDFSFDDTPVTTQTVPDPPFDIEFIDPDGNEVK